MNNREIVVSENGYETNSAGMNTNVADVYAHVPVAFEAVTVAQVAVALTDTVYAPSKAIKAVVTCENNRVRFRVDGGAPTASIGMLLDDGDILELYAEEIALCKFIGATTGSAFLNVTYFN